MSSRQVGPAAEIIPVTAHVSAPLPFIKIVAATVLKHWFLAKHLAYDADYGTLCDRVRQFAT